MYGEWIRLRDKTPKKGEKALFQLTFENDMAVGFWNDDENCATQYPQEGIGLKYLVSYWMPLPPAPGNAQQQAQVDMPAKAYS